ncbi:MAG: hypothetical protein ABSB63_16100 [Spirochaetia bacterium]|jgi:hypothetical protein
MSRGFGKVELEVFAALVATARLHAVMSDEEKETAENRRLFEIGERLIDVVRILEPQSPIAYAFGGQPSQSCRYSEIKRAVKSLERKGILESATYANRKFLRLKRTPVTDTLIKARAVS